MKKKLAVLLALMLLSLALTGCGSGDQQNVPTTAPQQRDPLSTEPTNPPAAQEGLGYDPLAEEDQGGAYLAGAVYDEYGNTVYAGATPIPINPIDMPTETPRPSLTFAYGAAQAPALGIQFEAPQGWTMNTESTDSVVLTDPETRDGVNAQLTVSILSVSSDYKLADVKTQVTDMLKEIGQYNYSQWTTTNLAERTLLKQDGYYANYRGVRTDGTIIRGRVMVALLEGNKIITVHMMVPGWFNESYMKVVDHFRDTLKTI